MNHVPVAVRRMQLLTRAIMWSLILGSAPLAWFLDCFQLGFSYTWLDFNWFYCGDKSGLTGHTTDCTGSSQIVTVLALVGCTWLYWADGADVDEMGKMAWSHNMWLSGPREITGYISEWKYRSSVLPLSISKHLPMLGALSAWLRNILVCCNFFGSTIQLLSWQ